MKGALALTLSHWVLSVSSLCEPSFPQCCPEGMVYDMNTCRPILGSVTKSVSRSGDGFHCPPSANNIPTCIGESPELVPFLGEPEYEEIYGGIHVTKVTLESNQEERLSYFSTNRKNYFPAFCFHDSLKGKVLICSKTQLERAQIKKCCPFGEKLGQPLFEGCVKSESSLNWNIRVNGYKKFLKELIKFPYENVVHKSSDFFKKLQSNSCAMGEERVFDVEAFEINMKGDLVFANGKVLDLSNEEYCVDSLQDPEDSTDEQLMVVLYCTSDKKVAESSRREFKDFLKIKSGAALLPTLERGLFLSTITLLGISQH